MLLVSSGVVGFLLLSGAIILFTVSWVLNHKTKVPESCKVNQKECVGCSFRGCPSFRPKEEEEKEEIVKTIDMDREVEEHLKENK